VAADRALGETLGWWANCLGITGAPFDSYLTLRGVRTLRSRIRDHLAATEAVVAALCAHPAVERVYYPGLAAHPGHEMARAQQSGFGAMVSFELRGGTAAVERLAASLRCFTLAESLGGVESLIAHPATMTHASMDPEARRVAGIKDSLVRLSVGIEDPADLADDLTTALDALLEPRRDAAVSAFVASSSETRPVVLLGAGSIGRELIGQLAHDGESRTLRVAALIDRSGYVSAPGGFTTERLAELRELKAAGQPLCEAIGGRSASTTAAVSEIIAGLERPIVVDLTPAETGDALLHAVSHGCDVVLANKLPLAAAQLSVDQLFGAARSAGAQILHEATVGAGLPVLDTLRKLLEAGDRVISIEGCPSGTLGYLFGELGRGEPFSAALRSAIALGYTEPDPRLDLSGIDVARKALILARAIGFRGELENVSVESLVAPAHAALPLDEFLARAPELDEPWARRVNDARRKGKVLRYRAHVTPTSIVVGLVQVKLTDRLGALSGTDNQFTFTTDRYLHQPLVISGPGAGPAVTAAGVLNDLLLLARRGAAENPPPRSGGPRTASARAENT
jgi:homoserine dehydrogenase